jgi:hypothetical protein
MKRANRFIWNFGDIVIMTRQTIVTADRWRDAMKFLQGQRVDERLSKADRKLLSGYLRGPFANGMRLAEAHRLLTSIGWRATGEPFKDAGDMA